MRLWRGWAYARYAVPVRPHPGSLLHVDGLAVGDGGAS
jgi:hypothetical protein